MAIEYKNDPPERYKWSPEDQKFLDNVWTALQTDYDSTIAHLTSMKKRLRAEGKPGVKSIEELSKVAGAFRHVRNLEESAELQDSITQLAYQLRRGGDKSTVTLKDKLSDWYGADAKKMANLPGMKAINLRAKIPVTETSEVPDEYDGRYSPVLGEVELHPSAKGPIIPQEPVIAHELGHATMDLAGNIQATDKFYDWDSVIRNTDLSEIPNVSEGAFDYVLGSHSDKKPAEFAAYLLEFVRTNKGTHPMLNPKGIEAGIDELADKMLTSKGRSAYRATGGIIKQNPQLKEDLIKFFSRYAENPKVTNTGDRYEIA